MERAADSDYLFRNFRIMGYNDLIVLSYHKFVEDESDYRFSRTYNQFGHDIRKKIYDLITIDDGMDCLIPACLMLRESNVRAKLFICTSLVGERGYCTWGELREVGKYHDIENHSHLHVDHREIDYVTVVDNIKQASEIIEENIGRSPRYFVAPYNWYNDVVDSAVESLDLTSIKNRVNILNISK
jgi:peptidoglycan/xylan/chitin deacetylase (PgdA/CDA1 family)